MPNTVPLLLLVSLQLWAVAGLRRGQICARKGGLVIVGPCDYGLTCVEEDAEDDPVSRCRPPQPQGLRVCFKETGNGGSGQCSGHRDTCSGWSASHPGQWTLPFRDDTDDRRGGCVYTWRVEQAEDLQPNREYRLCFRESEGSSQCGLNGAHRLMYTCTRWTSEPNGFLHFTSAFTDDTDSRGGGCMYQWIVEERYRPNTPALSCRLLFRGFSDGQWAGSRQCYDPKSGANSLATQSGWAHRPRWTKRFVDDTDGRWGWCDYQWGLQCRDAASFERDD